MRTWGFVSQKGGTGKTTLVLHVSVAAMSDGLAVSVFDLDPQRSAEQWSELRERLIETEEPAVIHGTPSSLDGMLAAARETDTELVLIDTPPALDKHMIYAAAVADLVVVPTRASVLDGFALKETLDYLDKIHALTKSVVVLNAPGSDAKDRSAIGRIASGFGVPVLGVTLENQPELAVALRDGRGITEGSRRRKGAKAILDLYGQLSALDRKLARSRKVNR